MNGYRFSVLIGRNNGDGWFASCPEFPGCEARAATYEDVVAAIREAIKVRVEDGLGDDEPIPQLRDTRLTALNLSV